MPFAALEDRAVLPVPGPAPVEGEWMLALQRDDQRLATIGYRLATRAGDLCQNQTALTGIAVQDVSQYGVSDQPVARRRFGFDGAPQILAVADDSPAVTAGVRPGDAVIAIDGVGVPAMRPGVANSTARIASIMDRLDRAAREGPVSLTLRRAGRTLEVRFHPVMGCVSRFQTGMATSVNAGADGDTVEVDTGAMHFAGDDGQIAAIVAHELAHNILHHRARLAAAGVRNERSSRGARLVRQTEEEADRLAVYLVDRAGYPPAAIVTLWTRIGQDPAQGSERAHTHLAAAQRVVLARGEIARIAAFKAAGKPARPAFMATGALPPLR